MKIKESIDLNHSVDDVWEILRNPGNMPAWNYKCYSCSGKEDVDIGSTFEATFKMSKASRVASCKIMELQTCRKISIRYSGKAFGSTGGFVDETFTLTSIGPKQTKLALEVDYAKSKMPILVKMLMWFINTFGRKAGQSSLDGIKDILEIT